MMNNVLDLRMQRKRHEVAYAVQEDDYSRYRFKKDFGKLQAEDAEVLLVLLTVAQLIPCETVKGQIRGAIDHDELRDWVIQDILMEADETFFDKFTIAKTMKNIYSIDEQELVEAFAQIANEINY